MQDPSMFQSMKPQIAEQEQLKCPRCDSNNTKFCYYNNYNLSQPRHFCKNCRRYWTKGGALRNIPVGGGSRKNSKRSSNPKRPSPSSVAAPPSQPPEPPALIYNPPPSIDQDRQLLDITGSFSSLLAPHGHFANLLETLNSGSPAAQNVQFGEFHEKPSLNPTSNAMGNPQLELQSSGSSSSEIFLGLQGDSSCWTGGNEWPDLAIYTPGSRFQ